MTELLLVAALSKVSLYPELSLTREHRTSARTSLISAFLDSRDAQEGDDAILEAYLGMSIGTMARRTGSTWQKQPIGGLKINFKHLLFE